MSVAIDFGPLKSGLSELLASALDITVNDALPLAEQIAGDYAEALATGRGDLLDGLKAQVAASALVIRKEASAKTAATIKGIVSTLFGAAGTALQAVAGGLFKGLGPADFVGTKA